MNESFENDFWLPYDKRVGKDKCFTKYALLSPTEHLKIKIHVPGFISSHRNKQYRPNPLSYLNGKMWLDEGKEKEGETQLYKFQDIRTKSDYEATPYPRSKGIEHMRDKLKKNYESGSYIKDYGGIYSTLLAHKAGYSLSGDKINEIHKEVREEATRKRNRFEEQYTGSIESDIRDKCLNLWLDNCRANNRDVSKEI